MQVILYDALVATPWVNGGGITREIAAKREADSIVWRISLADIQSEGPFSHFAKLHRILTVIAGEGMVLETDHGPLIAAPLVPISFAGDMAVTGRLPHGPIRDLNVIFHPDHIGAEVSVHTGPAEITPAGATDVVFVVSGNARIGDNALDPLATVVDFHEAVVLAEDAQALHITLRRKSA